MIEKAATPKNTNEYIAGFPPETQALLQQVRTAVKTAVPDAEEVISYQMPAYRFHGMLLFFAAYKNHIGFYPSGSGVKQFKEEIAAFKHSKGAIQFPLSKPMPADLITKIALFRAKENLEKASGKVKKKK